MGKHAGQEFRQFLILSHIQALRLVTWYLQVLLMVFTSFTNGNRLSTSLSIGKLLSTSLTTGNLESTSNTNLSIGNPASTSLKIGKPISTKIIIGNLYLPAFQLGNQYLPTLLLETYHGCNAHRVGAGLCPPPPSPNIFIRVHITSNKD